MNKKTLVYFFVSFFLVSVVNAQIYFNDSFEDSQAGFTLVGSGCHSGNCIKQYDTSGGATYGQLIDFGSSMNNTHRPITFYVYSTDYTNGGDNVDFHIGILPDNTPDIAGESLIWFTIREGEFGCYETIFSGSGVYANISDWYLLYIYPNYDTYTYNYSVRNQENTSEIAEQDNCNFRNNRADGRYIYYWYRDDYVIDGLYADELIIGNNVSAPPPNASATLTINHNLTNISNIEYEEIMFRYNGTYTNTGDLFNCSLLSDSIVNQTNEVNLSQNQNFSLDFGIIEHNFTIAIYCNNSDISDITDNYIYRVDTISPDVELISPTTLNNSNFVQGYNLQVTFNMTDLNIDGYNISWYNPDGTLIQEIYVTNLTGTSYINVSSYVLSSLGNNFSISIIVWDSHNPKRQDVKPLLWYTDNKNIFAEDFILEGDFKFYDKDENLLTYFYLSDNKYKMKLTFNKKNTTHFFNLSAKQYLRYINFRGYKGHFVYLPKSRYFDTEGKNIKEVFVKRCGNKYCLQVELFTENDEVELETIGDLNIFRVTYFFNVYSQDTVYLQQIATNTAEFNLDVEYFIQVVTMILIAIILLVLGFIFFAPLISLGGFVFIFLGYQETILTTNTEILAFKPILYIGIGVVFAVLGMVIFFLKLSKDNDNTKGFHDIF